MLVACQFSAIDRAGSLLQPAPVPSNYKTSDAIARHKERARQGVLEDVTETAACLQPTGALVVDGAGQPQRPTGAIAPWLMGVLYSPIVIDQRTVWTFYPRLLGRVVALSCLRLGQPKVPDWLFLSDRFRDPFKVLFGSGRFNKTACLASFGIRPLDDLSLEEQLRVLGELVSRIDTTDASAGKALEYGQEVKPLWGGSHD